MAKVKVYVCNFDDLNINSLSKLNWLPYCIDNVQWYVAEVSTFNSQTLQESTPIKIYKQGADGSVTITAPVGSITEGYCSQIHTETVYDIVNAAIGGTITYTYTSPTNIALNLNTVTVTNDSLVGFWTDFGDGYNDFGNVPDHSYNADGSYEIKTYAILNSKNKILINAKEVIITNGVVAYAPTGTSSTINRPYRHVVNTALQNYCGNTPVDNPYLADGTSYTPTGTLGLHLDAIIDELEDNAEWNPENVADLVECVVGSANLVTEGLDGNITAAASVAIGGSPNAIVHTLLGNTLAINGAGTNGQSSAGLNVNISGGTFSAAQFTFNINVIGDEDPLDSADMGITVWDNVAGISVTATTITSSLSYLTDAQGVGLNMPIYAYPSTGSHTIVWTGDLPAGDYTVILLTQDQGVLDMIELSVDHNIVSGPTTTTKAQLVALDQCTIDALTPVPVVTPIVQRRHENFVQTGTTPLVIPAGAIAISVTKTNNTGVINISGDNATAFPLTFNRENFTDSVNESVSTLSAYTITGTLAGTTFKVHIIR